MCNLGVRPAKTPGGIKDKIKWTTYKIAGFVASLGAKGERKTIWWNHWKARINNCSIRIINGKNSDREIEQRVKWWPYWRS